MEYRLFFIGALMGAFVWFSRGWKDEGGPASPLASALWHGLFFAFSGFSVVMILAMSMETRARFISFAYQTLSVGEVYPALAAGALFGGYGFWRAWSTGESVESRRHFLNEDLEWAQTVFEAAFTASLLMLFVIQAFKIPSASMQNTLLIGDHLFVNKFIYGFRVPFTERRVLGLEKIDRGDVMVFQFPVEDPRELHCGSVQYGKDFIKRVIGLPGDVIEVRQGQVIVNDQPLGAEPYVVHSDRFRMQESLRAKEIDPARYQKLWQEHGLDREFEDQPADYASLRDYFGPVKVPEHSYFMMGDNRDQSCDSRFWGPVDERFVKGKAWLLYWPPDHMKTVR
jgi:signal peptidase I